MNAPRPSNPAIARAISKPGVKSGGLRFSEVEIQGLFGHEAAEDEIPKRLQDYYFKTDTFDEFQSDVPLRLVVGHKGIGKSALIQIAMLENKKSGILSILIKPDDIADIATDTTDHLRTVRLWKDGLIRIISSRALEGVGAVFGDELAGRVASTSGNIISFLRETLKTKDKYDLKPVNEGIIDSFLKTGQISVFIDDLDRGWKGRQEDITRISALLNATRDLVNENRGLKIRISLRSDVYYLVRTSDESTDKIEGSVMWLSWTNHEIFVLLVKRIETFFSRAIVDDSLLDLNANRLARYLDPVMMPKFEGAGLWQDAPIHKVLMSLIRKRPRDLVKLCTLAARSARKNKNSLIATKDFQSVFSEYSQGRIRDTINEYRSELPEIERLILGMKPSKKEKKTSEGYLYDTAALLKKIDNIVAGGDFYFASGKKATKKELAAFMYKINFLTARRDRDNQKIARSYFEENRYLSNEFVDFGFDWEVHPAYRWALQPDNLESIFETLALSDDD
jgi:hypothetical protein